ncbi:hypothetical protein C345_03826 [Cryptococcus neoformans A2-102-5]|nr:hypothetical protein C345_03826 [Cryptococcus neoformans var. grubii A2-102-5]
MVLDELDSLASPRMPTELFTISEESFIISNIWASFQQ